MALLAAAACEDDIDHAKEIHATASEIHSVTTSSAVFEAAIYGEGITERGVCWSESQNPTPADYATVDEGTGSGEFTAFMDGLKANTTYYARAYAIGAGKTYYSSQINFTTYPEVTATIKSTIAGCTIVSVKADVQGGLSTWTISEKGICYGTSPDPTTAGTKVKASTGGKGEFEVAIEDLEDATTYYLRPYAVYDYGTVYGEQQTVTTLSADELKTLFFTMMEKGNLWWGGLYKGNDLAMHYSFDADTEAQEVHSVTISYIESGTQDAKHVTLPVEFNDDYSELTWEAVENGDVLFGGVSVDVVAGVNTIGSAGLSIFGSMSATDILAMLCDSNSGGVNRVNELRGWHPSMNEAFSGLDCSEWAGTYVGVMVRYDAIDMWYTCFQCKRDASGMPRIEMDQDVAKFDLGSTYVMPYGGSDANVDQLREKVGSIIDFFAQEDGVILVKETKNNITPLEGDYYYMAISKTGKTWIRMYLRKNGA